ncbi:hypothetical protein G8V07_14360 [Clostridium botulinum D/C]|uniref:hypothetical protein n=1 Tax=Clostridium botulinum TaxID=1491 RepID=UPI001E5F9094|nr:hypothetical protein [Clostridium botulinum]MCD3321627.1 hypothetical protein [Clostridium botulinum D/C]MCD3324908.1 hypothetical protein [Clostridium botulinum D/C]MCD3328153.1 hypothetical protein [Clostridium botulinum D/C]
MYEIINIERLASTVNKYDMSIVITNSMSLESLKHIIETELIPKAHQQLHFDELYLGFFEDENLMGLGTTLGYAICSPTGDFSGKYKLNHDLSNMKIGYDNLTNFEDKWNNRLTHKEAIMLKDMMDGFKEENTSGDGDAENEVIRKVASKHNVSFNEADAVIFKHAKHFGY